MHLISMFKNSFTFSYRVKNLYTRRKLCLLSNRNIAFGFLDLAQSRPRIWELCFLANDAKKIFKKFVFSEISHFCAYKYFESNVFLQMPHFVIYFISSPNSIQQTYSSNMQDTMRKYSGILIVLISLSL